MDQLEVKELVHKPGYLSLIKMGWFPDDTTYFWAFLASLACSL